jgi:hypothetical protein
MKHGSLVGVWEGVGGLGRSGGAMGAGVGSGVSMLKHATRVARQASKAHGSFVPRGTLVRFGCLVQCMKKATRLRVA